MDPEAFCKLARRLMSQPTAPYHEHLVRAQVEQICREHGLKFARDPYGNVLVRLDGTSRSRTLVLAAHLDHPGFEIIRKLSKLKWLGRFRGGVPDNFFRVGIPLRLMPGNVPATLGPRVRQAWNFEIRASERALDSPSFAVWDMEAFGLRRGHIHGRACDDLIGVASILATMIELKRRRARVRVWGVISRAEEVGFHGALAVAAIPEIPKRSLVISLETSRELPPVRMDKGVIIRVGDRTSIFDPDASRFLTQVAEGLRKNGFEFQRALMSGGTCEGTAYQAFGFQTGAVCVALGNYHNCAAGNRIKAECVSLSDACGMVDLLVATAKQMGKYSAFIERLPRSMRQLWGEAEPMLRKTAEDPN